MAKEFLSQHKIHFVERDVNVDPQAAYELQKRNISGVPTVFIGEDVIVGLDKQRILQLVDHRLVACSRCGQKLRVPLNKGVLQVKCPKCQNEFSVTT